MNIVSEVRIVLDEVSPVFWTNDHIYDAVNSALLETITNTKYAKQAFVLPVNQGDDIVSLPSECMIPLWIEKSGLKMYATTHAKLEQWNRYWRLEELKEPKFFVLWDAGHLRVWPRPDQAYDFTLWGVPFPTLISLSNEQLDADRMICKAVIYRAAALLLEHTLPQVAQEFLKDSEDYERRYAIQLRQAQSHRILQVRPATTLTSAESGDIRSGLLR